MKLEISTKSFSNYILIFFFIFLIPIQEWPDTSTHFERYEFYSAYLINFANFFNISLPQFISNNNFSFFSDTYIYFGQEDEIILNFAKLFFIIPIFYFINKFSIILSKKPIEFAPPYIFALLAASLEPFAIAISTIGYLLLISKRTLLALIISFAATLIDRSMVPTLVSLILYSIYLTYGLKILFRSTFYILAIIILILYLLNFFPSSPFSSILGYYGVTSSDLEYNLRFGDNNYFALLTSLSGLYGWMSLRPSPWFIYYPLLLFLFLIGFIKNERSEKIKLICFLAPIMIVLYFLPPLSQARYYPILILLYWENIMIGIKSIFKKDDAILLLIMLMTLIGLILPKFS